MLAAVPGHVTPWFGLLGYLACTVTKGGMQ